MSRLTAEVRRRGVVTTVADGARTSSLDALTFPLVLDFVSDTTTGEDHVLLRAIFYLWEPLKLVVEPTGALGAAVLLETDVAQGAGRVAVMLSRGDVDLSQVEK